MQYDRRDNGGQLAVQIWVERFAAAACLLLLLLVLLLLLLAGLLDSAGPSSRPRSFIHSFVRSFRLVSLGVGWAVVDLIVLHASDGRLSRAREEEYSTAVHSTAAAHSLSESTQSGTAILSHRSFIRTRPPTPATFTLAAHSHVTYLQILPPRYPTLPLAHLVVSSIAVLLARVDSVRPRLLWVEVAAAAIPRTTQ